MSKLAGNIPQIQSQQSPKDVINIDALISSTNFDRREFDVLLMRFASLNPTTSNTGMERIDRQHFRDLLGKQFGITDSLLMDRVFRVFDQDADNHVGFQEFIKGMSVYLKGKPSELLNFCFKVYDLNNDRYISKEEMFQLLQYCLVKGTDEDEDGIKDIVDLVMKKLDEDRDGRVNEQDWSSAVQKDFLLLEAFGQCIPNQREIDEFLDVSSQRERSKVETSSKKSTYKLPQGSPDKKTKAGMAI